MGAPAVREIYPATPSQSLYYEYAYLLQCYRSLNTISFLCSCQLRSRATYPSPPRTVL